MPLMDKMAPICHSSPSFLHRDTQDKTFSGFGTTAPQAETPTFPPTQESEWSCERIRANILGLTLNPHSCIKIHLFSNFGIYLCR